MGGKSVLDRKCRVRIHSQSLKLNTNINYLEKNPIQTIYSSCQFFILNNPILLINGAIVPSPTWNQKDVCYFLCAKCKDMQQSCIAKQDPGIRKGKHEINLHRKYVFNENYLNSQQKRTSIKRLNDRPTSLAWEVAQSESKDRSFLRKLQRSCKIAPEQLWWWSKGR